MDIYGCLTDFPLRELLTLCVETMISGALVVMVEAGQHTLYFAEGHLHHATGPDGTGYAAVWPLFELSDAPYHFYVGRRVRSHTIGDATPAVLARAERLAQAWARMRPFIAGPRVVPVLASPPSDDHVQINEEDWPVLACIDGQRSIADIAVLAALEELDVCHSLLRLRQRGLVELGDQRPLLPQLSSPSPAHTTIAALPQGQARSRGASQGGFFTRVLATLPLVARTNDLPAFAEPMLAARSAEHDAILRMIRMS